MDLVKIGVIPDRNVNQQDADGLTLCMWAAANNQLDVLKFLQDRGADFNIVGHRSENALLLAAAGGHTLVLQLLLRAGVDVNHTCQVQTNVLQAECSVDSPVVGCVVCFCLLFRPDIFGSQNKCTCDSWHRNLTLFRVSNPGRMTFRPCGFVWLQKNNSALCYAVLNNHVDSVKVLLEWGADLTVRNTNGHCALDIAILRGNKDGKLRLSFTTFGSESCCLIRNEKCVVTSETMQSLKIFWLAWRGGHLQFLLCLLFPHLFWSDDPFS